MVKKAKSHFPVTGKITENKLKSQIENFRTNSLISFLFDAVPDLVLIINREREAVFVNKSFLKYLETANKESILGKRPGQILDCIHANENHGCGTTEFCGVCGAARAIHYSQQKKEDCRECRIIKLKNNEAIDLRVWTTPFKSYDEYYTIFIVSDISHEKKKDALESIFYHDILNTAGAIQGFSELLENAGPYEIVEYSRIIAKSVEKLIEEISSHRDLEKAENNELIICLGEASSCELIKDIAGFYRNQKIANCIFIHVDNFSKNTVFTTDIVLMKRILGNMLKNALEASKKGDIVTLNTERDVDNVYFHVHNRSYIPRELQLQIFQRSFSTKSRGRGLGTYSMKLLGEKYLKGKVSFESNEKKGTTFTAGFPIEYNS